MSLTIALCFFRYVFFMVQKAIEEEMDFGVIRPTHKSAKLSRQCIEAGN